MNPVRLALLSLVLLPLARTEAQGSPIEWGVDAAVTVSFDPTVTIVSIPVSQVRAGFFFTPTLELEPRLGLLSISGSGERFTQTQLDVGLLMHLGASRLQTQTYLRPFVGISSTDVDDGDSATGGNAGIGLGWKFPLGTRFAFRPEVNYRHLFGDLDDDQLQVLAGFSVFTR